MPPKDRASVQRKHSGPSVQGSRRVEYPISQPAPLLFVNKGQHNVGIERSVEEQTAIKQHLSQRQQKKSHFKPISFHASTQRILNSDEKHDDEQPTELTPRGQPAFRNASSEKIVNITAQLSLTSRALGSRVLDPFVPQSAYSKDAAKLTFMYLRHLRPLAAAVSPEWDWIDNVAEIQCSEMLSNAIAAYTTAFFDGLKGGSPSVVLPPLPEKGKQPLWHLPVWFCYYNQCLSSLNETLLDTEKASKSEVYHTILFLLRLTVLFGDGPAANMHFKALRQVAAKQSRSPKTLSYEAAVTQVNFITLFLYKASMIKMASLQITEEHPAFVIEPDRQQWVDDREWTKFAGMLYGRSLTWHAKSLEALDAKKAQRIVLRLDPQAAQLPSTTLQEAARYYQTALFLWSYLCGINFDPSLPKIRLHISELEHFLKTTDTDVLERLTPNVLFFLYFCGTAASRGQPNRRWFLQRLKSTTVQVHSMRDLWGELEKSADPAHWVPILLEEILQEMGRKDIYAGGRYQKWYGPIPINRDPDLGVPIRDAQQQD